MVMVHLLSPAIILRQEERPMVVTVVMEATL